MINFVFEYITLVAISKRFGDGTSEAKKSVEDQWRLPRWEWRGVLEEDDDPGESEKHTKLHSGKMNRTSISPV